MPDYDIFLSYATVDDTTLVAEWAKQETWVKCFKVALQQAVNKELGRAGSAELFYDAKDIRTGEELNSKIEEALDRTSIFVAILSKGYFHEESWCNLEREHFIDLLGSDAERKQRVFGVLLDENILQNWQDECFPSVRAFPFYEKNEADESCARLGEVEIDAQFLRDINRLGKDLADRIEKYRAGNEPDDAHAAEVQEEERKGTVFLAAVPGEIEHQRAELADALQSAGWQVSPRENVCHVNPEECKKEARELGEEEDTTAFVQLLSQFAWKPGRYDMAQFQGVDGALPSFQFLEECIDLQNIPDEEHRSWLQSGNIKVRSFPKLKKLVIQEIEELLTQKEQAQARADPELAWVTLSVSELGSPYLQNELLPRLEESQIFGIVKTDDPPQFDLPYSNEDGVIVVFGDEPYKQHAEKGLLDWRRLLAKHRARPGTTPPIAVFLSEPPPNNKREYINMTLPDLHLLEWNDPEAWAAYIADVRNFATTRANREEGLE